LENLHSADKREVGRIIFKLRSAANLTQTDLGKLIRVRRHHIISWENGESCPQEAKLRRLIAVFVA
jgi:DNA-binding XRE family transcriptional regulator